MMLGQINKAIPKVQIKPSKLTNGGFPLGRVLTTHLGKGWRRWPEVRKEHGSREQLRHQA